MARKTVIWIIIAVLALALVAAVGIAFGAGRQASSAVISQVRPAGLVNPLLPIRPGRLVGPFVQLPGSGPAVRIVAPIGG